MAPVAGSSVTYYRGDIWSVTLRLITARDDNDLFLSVLDDETVATQRLASLIAYSLGLRAGGRELVIPLDTGSHGESLLGLTVTSEILTRMC
ncbi:MAG: hypothetical protein JWO42_1579 [Chloroflexi bacterium]|nr:hypothetical protein [Chloroflexota bacterium]